MPSSRGSPNPGLLHCRQIFYRLSCQGSPRTLEQVACPFYRDRRKFPTGELPDPGIEPHFPSLQQDSLAAELPGKTYLLSHFFLSQYFLAFHIWPLSSSWAPVHSQILEMPSSLCDPQATWGCWSPGAFLCQQFLSVCPHFFLFICLFIIIYLFIIYYLFCAGS